MEEKEQDKSCVLYMNLEKLKLDLFKMKLLSHGQESWGHLWRWFSHTVLRSLLLLGGTTVARKKIC